MSLKVELGLFTLDFTDYHAILGVPVDAAPKDIRKHYLKIARRLHPDSASIDNDLDRQRAAEYLSKLVNPAYEKLSQEKNYTEYCLLLKLKGQQAMRQQETVMLVSESARRLASATGDIEQPYRAALKELTEKQYELLEQTLELTGFISELNLVYLMRKAKQGEPIAPAAIPVANRGKPSEQNKPGSSGFSAPPQKAPATKADLVGAYLRRAKEFENKQDFPKAILELREAIQMDPGNAACHTRLGEIYLKLRQLTMAKIHFNQALKLNPKDSDALEGVQKLEQALGNDAAKPNNKTSKPASKSSKPNASGGGMFGGIFGGKKK